MSRGEWERIESIYQKLAESMEHDLALPSALLSKNGSQPVVQVTTPEQPVTVKKQRKYNINRWALSGRNDLDLNSRCYRVNRSLGAETNQENLEKLCFAWSSDFRTHITADRWAEANAKLAQLESDLGFTRGEVGSSWEIDPKSSTADSEGKTYRLSNEQTALELDHRTGLTIRGFGFQGEKPLLGLIPHSFYDDIEYGADFFTGHMVIHPPAERVRTTISRATDYRVMTHPDQTIQAIQQSDWGTTTSEFALDGRTLVITRKIELPRRAAEVIRVCNFSFLPDSWDRETLFYSTHNGGTHSENFPLAGHAVDHSDPVSWFTSAEFGVGMTEGAFVVGDKDRSVVFEVCPHGHRVLPKLQFAEIDGGKNFFLRLEFSARELDETFRPNDEPEVIETAIRVTLSGPRADAPSEA